MSFTLDSLLFKFKSIFNIQGVNAKSIFIFCNKLYSYLQILQSKDNFFILFILDKN